ncbi:MAG: SDR family oxidoreductase [Acidobacteriota bacterium]|nr:SDR family oxidoreductase [Acidobacteriota bacterium]
MEYALITGASGGIGESFARALAARKSNLILVARSEEKLKVLGDELAKAHGIMAESVALDLSEPGAASKLFETVERRGLQASLLINNAGFGAQGRAWEIDFTRQAQMMRLNIQALVEITSLFLPRMIQKRRGGVINVSSTASFQPLPYTSVYAASKAFVTSFSMGLAEEARPYGISVVTLCPGTTRTNFFEAGEYKSMNMRMAFQSPEAVARAGLKQLDRGGGLVVSRKMDEVLILAERLLPRSWVARLTAGIFRPK